MTDEVTHLRRRLRAMAALNHQLLVRIAELEAEVAPPAGTAAPDPLADPPAVDRTPVGSARRRARAAAPWELGSPLVPVASLEVVMTADGARFVLESGRRRRIRAALLVPALEAHLGETRPVTDEEVAELPEGPPVEVLEGPDGPPFVVLAGQRLPVRRLPLPHPVGPEVAEGWAEGPALDLSSPVVVLPPPPPPPEPPKRSVIDRGVDAGLTALRRGRRAPDDDAVTDS